jgi:uncharacterized membrane protein
VTPSPRFTRALAIALCSAAVAWTAAVFFVAFDPGSHAPPELTAAVHAVGSLVCHQRPERSFHANHRRFPVCARCTGLYVSGAAGAIVGWVGLAVRPRRARLMIILAAAPTILTLAAEWSGIAGSSNLVRALSALPLGGAAGWLFVRMLRAESASSTCAMIA